MIAAPHIDRLDNECLLHTRGLGVPPFSKEAEDDAMKYRIAAAIAGFALIAPIAAEAATVSYSLTADNAFALYVSNSDSTLGTRVFTNLGPITTASQWDTAFTGSFNLSGSSPEYVHVIGFNYTLSNGLWTSAGTANGAGGNPDAFIGNLSINLGSGYYFAANSSTSLNTAQGTWNAIMVPPSNPDVATAGPNFSDPGWLTPNSAPASYGANGVGPWGTVAGINAAADWIWSIPDNGAYADFSTEILFEGRQAGPNPQVTPLPGALALFVGGLGMIGMVAGRKKRKTVGGADSIAAV